MLLGSIMELYSLPNSLILLGLSPYGAIRNLVMLMGSMQVEKTNEQWFEGVLDSW
jgi:hypothetical protein